MGTGAVREGDRELDLYPVIGEQWAITKGANSAEDSSDELFESLVWIDPHMPGPPPHVHPSSEESIEVLKGSLEVLKNGRWTTLRPNETANLAANVAHTFRNSGDETAKVLIRIRPAGRSEAFFRHMGTLIAERKVKHLPPKDLGSAIYIAMLFREYRDWTRPQGPINAFFKAMAFAGKMLRYKL